MCFNIRLTILADLSGGASSLGFAKITYSFQKLYNLCDNDGFDRSSCVKIPAWTRAKCCFFPTIKMQILRYPLLLKSSIDGVSTQKCSNICFSILIVMFVTIFMNMESSINHEKCLNFLAEQEWLERAEHSSSAGSRHRLFYYLQIPALTVLNDLFLLSKNSKGCVFCFVVVIWRLLSIVNWEFFSSKFGDFSKVEHH